MYHITRDEVMSLLQNLRQIRQKSGEMIAFLEHMMELQGDQTLKPVNYNPDDYLELREAYTQNSELVRQEIFDGSSFMPVVDDI